MLAVIKYVALIIIVFVKKGRGRMKVVAIIIISVLLVMGAVLLVGTLASVDFDFTRLGGGKYEIYTHDIDGSFTDICINVDTADIKFAVAPDGKCRAEFFEDKKVRYTAEVERETLNIKIDDHRRWYDYIGVNFGIPKITLYLPVGAYRDLSVRNSTGNTEIPDGFDFENIGITASTGNISLTGTKASSLTLSLSTGNITVSDVNVENDVTVSVSTGKVSITDLACRNLSTVGDTGDIMMTDVSVSGCFDAKRSTGDISFEDLDANIMTVKTSTGHVKGSITSDKAFDVKTDTGKIKVPHVFSDSENKIKTSTGDVIINVVTD